MREAPELELDRIAPIQLLSTVGIFVFFLGVLSANL